MLTQNGNSRSTGEERPMSGLNPYTKKRTTNGFYARSLFRQPITRWREPGNVKSPHPQPRTLTRRETSSETLRLTLVNIYRVRCELSRNNLYSYRHFFPFSRISRSIPSHTIPTRRSSMWSSRIAFAAFERERRADLPTVLFEKRNGKVVAAKLRAFPQTRKMIKLRNICSLLQGVDFATLYI